MMVITVVSMPRTILELSGLIPVIVRLKVSFGSRAMRSSIIGPLKQALILGSDAGIVTVAGMPDGV